LMGVAVDLVEADKLFDEFGMEPVIGAHEGEGFAEGIGGGIELLMGLEEAGAFAQGEDLVAGGGGFGEVGEGEDGVVDAVGGFVLAGEFNAKGGVVGAEEVNGFPGVDGGGEVAGFGGDAG